MSLTTTAVDPVVVQWLGPAARIAPVIELTVPMPIEALTCDDCGRITREYEIDSRCDDILVYCPECW